MLPRMTNHVDQSDNHKGSGLAGAGAGGGERGLDFAGQVVAFGVGGEAAFGDVVAIALERRREELRAVGILARELCGRRECEVEEIVEDEDLAVAVRSEEHTS